ncbi:adenosylcobinamide-phosphate synthase CbiB [Sulfitobacter sp. S190]|uniref:adenosylcobinamide-phosphate synthase CbiB n=1 Tax=Sulfitobacter sp. S190 TaxID=2867022 RepID=UPI0021A57474|nr:adenosylcobinamide-phosphate synthase CbiB [Sulfitobacter sp. S190]UWR22880.1 adenosylcobinamide-phosphate synthase CbiB [Sulfitobacter sp. S190]
MTTTAVLTLALVLDALLGEPQWLWARLPHPAVLMGRLVGGAEKRFNSGTNRMVKGGAVIAALVAAMLLLGQALAQLGWVVEILVCAVLLAQKSLLDHVRAVATGLRMSPAAGRAAVAMIVSRDTGDMTPSAVARSAIESGAENLCDGVIAPAFWFVLGGLPGLLAYKIVNTADSMIGYRTDRFEQFGKAAARLDDLLNWLPARLTAVLIALSDGIPRHWRAIAADARLHRSPNAGWPEAAMAYAINVALAGPRAYDGVMQDFAWVNPAGSKHIGALAIDAAASRLWQAWALFLVAVLTLATLL